MRPRGDTAGRDEAGRAAGLDGGAAIERHEPGSEPAGGPAAGAAVAGVPLAELHVHLEATATPALVRRLAARNDVEIPPGTVDGDRYVWRDFLDFLATFDRAVTVVRTAEDYRDITFEYLEACAAEGAIYVEVTASADHADQAGLPYGDMIAGVARGIDDARASSGVESRIVVTAVRNFGTERVEWVARTAAGQPHPYVTGFGLAGDEAGFPPGQFARAFEIAHEAGLGLTCHAGEWAGPESVREALALPVPMMRLGHGVRAIEDPALVRELAERGTVLEVCPTSNVVLGAYPGYAEHPFPALRDAGVRVTLGSDDPPYWEASIGGEYAVARRDWGLDDAALTAITQTAIEAAFVPAHVRNALLARIQQ
jgi:adenosine deaminase